MKIATQTARAIAKYLEEVDIQELTDSHFDHAEGRVTPASMRNEIEKLRRWVAILRGSPGTSKAEST